MKNKERIQKLKETEDSRYIYQNELDKACFKHYMAYGDFKDLPRRTASDRVLSDKAFNIAENPRYDGYQRGLAAMVCKFFDKKPSGDAVTRTDKSVIKGEYMSNQQLIGELHKPIIEKLTKNSLIF